MTLKIKIFNEFNFELKSLWKSFDDSSTLCISVLWWQNYWSEKVEPKYKVALFIIICFIDDEVNAIFPMSIKWALGARF